MSEAADLCAVTVDLDPPSVLLRYHGATDRVDDGAFYAAAIPRLLDVFTEFSVRATFFVVGAQVAEHAIWMRRLADAGHEIANHGHTHRYALGRASAREVDEEIGVGERAIADTTGQRPVGFRAPGYDAGERILRALEERGYAYDSSVFPSIYIAAVRGYQVTARLRGRREAGAVGRLSFLRAPLGPYRPLSTSLWRDDPRRAIVEIPIATLPFARLPFHHSAILSLGRGYLSFGITRLGRGNRCFALHGIDALGADRDPIPPALRSHPGGAMPLGAKLDLLRDVLAALARTRRLVAARDLVAATRARRHALDIVRP